MYDKNSSGPLLNSPQCLNQAAFGLLGLITFFWIGYLLLTPPDPALGVIAHILRRLVSLGIAAAWIGSLAVSGLVWIIAYVAGRRR